MPLQALHVPLQAMQALYVPLQALQALYVPLQALYVPLQAMQALYVPLQALHVPLQALYVPLQALQAPQEPPVVLPPQNPAPGQLQPTKMPKHHSSQQPTTAVAARLSSSHLPCCPASLDVETLYGTHVRRHSHPAKPCRFAHWPQ